MKNKISHIRRMLISEEGLTLTELLIVSTLLLMATVMFFSVLSLSQKMSSSSAARTEASSENQLAIAMISKDIRGSQENNLNDKGTIVISQSNQLQMYSDIDNDRRPEMVRYYVDGTALKRAIKYPTNTTTPMPPTEWTFGAEQTPKTVIAKLSGAGVLFCYHGRVENPTFTCPSGQQHGFIANVKAATGNPYNSTVPHISMIGMSITNSATKGGETVSITRNALVRIRSIDNEVQ